MTNKEWFREAKYGMMIHFGLYSLLEGEWKGKRMGNTIGEWAQSYFRIPNAEYEKLAQAFNPIFFDAEEWVTLAKESGMQYMVVTAKHHEGFALFHSKADKFNSVDATPFGRDIIKELSDACRKHGLKFGVYYSQALDWRERNAGGWGEECGINVEGMPWYRPERPDLPPPSPDRKNPADGLTKKQMRMYTASALKAGLLVTLVMCAGLTAFVAFCVFVWFR